MGVMTKISDTPVPHRSIVRPDDESRTTDGREPLIEAFLREVTYALNASPGEEPADLEWIRTTLMEAADPAGALLPILVKLAHKYIVPTPMIEDLERRWMTKFAATTKNTAPTEETPKKERNRQTFFELKLTNTSSPRIMIGAAAQADAEDTPLSAYRRTEIDTLLALLRGSSASQRMAIVASPSGSSLRKRFIDSIRLAHVDRLSVSTSVIAHADPSPEALDRMEELFADPNHLGALVLLKEDERAVDPALVSFLRQIFFQNALRHLIVVVEGGSQSHAELTTPLVPFFRSIAAPDRDAVHGIGLNPKQMNRLQVSQYFYGTTRLSSDEGHSRDQIVDLIVKQVPPLPSVLEELSASIPSERFHEALRRQSRMDDLCIQIRDWTQTMLSRQQRGNNENAPMPYIISSSQGGDEWYADRLEQLGRTHQLQFQHEIHPFDPIVVTLGDEMPPEMIEGTSDASETPLDDPSDLNATASTEALLMGGLFTYAPIALNPAGAF